MILITAVMSGLVADHKTYCLQILGCDPFFLCYVVSGCAPSFLTVACCRRMGSCLSCAVTCARVIVFRLSVVRFRLCKYFMGVAISMWFIVTCSQ